MHHRNEPPIARGIVDHAIDSSARQGKAARAALIMLGEDAPDAAVAGVPWPEFRMREAVAAGARHLAVCAERMPRGLIEAIDRLRKEGVSVSIVRTSDDVATVFHPDEIVLLMSGRAIVDADVLRELIDGGGHAVLALAAGQASEAFERIDADDRWTGFARIDGAMVRDTARAAGEWDLAAMLLRRSLQARAVRQICDPARLVEGAEAATLRRLVLADSGGGVMQHALHRLAAGLARQIAGHLPTVVRFAQPGLAAISAITLGTAVFAQPAAAFGGLILLELWLVMLAIAASATAMPVRYAWLFDHAASAIFASVLLVGYRSFPPMAALAAVPLAAMAMIAQMSPISARWQPDRVTYAVLMLGAILWQGAAPMVVVIAVTGWALAALWFVQNRLSRLLTQPR